MPTNIYHYICVSEGYHLLSVFCNVVLFIGIIKLQDMRMRGRYKEETEMIDDYG